MANIENCVAERGEFELPVPICEQSDDSIRLSFAKLMTCFLRGYDNAGTTIMTASGRAALIKCGIPAVGGGEPMSLSVA